MLIYLAKPGGQREGPFTLEQINRDLADKKYSDDDYWAWHEGLANWMPLHAVPGVSAKAAANVPAPPKPAKAPTPAPARPAGAAPAISAASAAAPAELEKPSILVKRISPEPTPKPAAGSVAPEPVAAPAKRVAHEPPKPTHLEPATTGEPVAPTSPIKPVSPQPAPKPAVKPTPVEFPVKPITHEPPKPTHLEPGTQAKPLAPASPAKPVTPEPAPKPSAAAVEPEPTEAAVKRIVEEPPKPARVEAGGRPGAAEDATASAEEKIPSGLPFDALEQIFVFTTGEGRAVFDSPAVAQRLQMSVGEPLSAIRGRVQVDVIGHVDLGVEVVHEDFIPEKAWRAMSIIKPTITQQARSGSHYVCVRPVLAEGNEIVTLFLFYNKQKI